ncbi:MAG: cytochrome c oxidase subunit 3 [Dehalococcoidia bacterium]
MAASAEHLQAGHSELKFHHPPRRMNQVGLWLFFFSETFLFGAMITARFYISGTSKPEHLNQMLGLAITTVLLLSSVTAYQSEAAIKRGQVGLCLAYLFATMAMGVVFVGGVTLEWATAEFHPWSPYGTAFFSMTGLHATHVVSGIVILFLVYRLARRGRFTAERTWPVEAAVKYWHFVDVVWVFFYPALYLLHW